MTHLHYSRSTISICILLTGLAACSNSGNDENVPLISEGNDPAEPLFSATLFDEDSSTIDNPLFPMTPGALLIYEGTSDEGETERVEIHVSHQTRRVDGVESRIAIAREYLDGEMVEEAFDWFAQDTDGNVWYMGEASNEYENGVIASTQGSWESGADVENVGHVASAGIIMKATPVLGDQYRQEEYPGVAEDSAQVVDLDSPQTLANGQSYSTVKILEWNPLESDSSEYKYYANGTGMVVDENADGSERIELVAQSDQRMPQIRATDFSNPTLIDHPYFPLTPGAVRHYEVYEDDELIETIEIQVLSATDEQGSKTVNGVPVRVQRDRVSDAEGNILEDTYDWFAQDDAGNVWYLGEAVTNYNYDDDGNFLGTDDGGSFEWGVDNAQPGILMLASPRVGDSYRQEYYAGEAEDIAAVVGLDVSIEVSGISYSTLKTEEWNPLEEDSTEFKYYADGIGVIREEKADGSEYVVLVGQ